MSLQPVVRAVAFATSAPAETSQTESPPAAADDALEFVRFCYRRRRVPWPALYDEMVAVAARGAFRGLGYNELAERGISFCLGDLPRLVAVTERVVREEQLVAQPRPAAMSLTVAPARS